MTNEERMQFLKNMATLIFQGKALAIEQWATVQVPQGVPITKWQPRGFVNNTIYGIDVDLNLGDRIIQLRLMEQSPNKVDHNGNLKTFANLARQGHQIMWIIDQNAGWLGRIQDGQWHASQDRATSPAQPTQAVEQNTGPATQNRSTNDEIPDVDIGIPEYVLRHYSEMEGPDE